ncbi:hypothetical protein [Algibacter sp. L1A34]|uniref:hypothetical protein n=1 Tax=Algibacter sp. L1A34 TaxID=2686365 RepID=UPI00131D0225|nr:hypothetical protein [Algibacter sp. L1A34]
MHRYYSTTNIKVGNEDTVKLREYMVNNWDQFDAEEIANDKADVLERSKRISTWGFYDLWNVATAK